MSSSSSSSSTTFTTSSSLPTTQSQPRQLPPVPTTDGDGGDRERKKQFSRPVKSVVPKLRDSAVNLSAVRKAAFEEMSHLIDTIPGEKTLVLDPAIIGPLSLVIPLSILMSKGVHMKIEKLDGGVFEPHCDTVVVLARSRIDTMRLLVHLLRHWQQSKRQVRVHLYLVPRRTMICEMVLERAAVYHMIQSPIGQYSGLDAVVFDNDLLSMEQPHSFREVAMDGDNSSLYATARSIMKLQSLFGLIPNVRYIGTAGQTVFEMMDKLRTQIESSTTSGEASLFGNESEITQLILFDRSVDLVSPLVTPLTYEGLVNDLFGISNNLVSLSDIVDSFREREEQTGKRQRMPLNDDDTIFQEIRHISFLAVGQRLKGIARTIDEIYEQRKTLKETADIKEYFYKLPELQQRHDDLAAHISIAQAIKRATMTHEFRKTVETEQKILSGADDKDCIDFIEQCIIRQEPLSRVLRLICLMSVVKNGLGQKEYNFFKRELVQSYGHFVLLTLENLERVNLFKRQESKGLWPSLRKSMRLIEDNVNEHEPETISYVHSGYAPLSVRIIEAMQNIDGWKLLSSSLGKSVPIGHSDQQGARASQTPKKVTLVYFIGGCTFAEISALRFLSSKSPNSRFIVATSKLINGNNFLTPLFETGK